MKSLVLAVVLALGLASPVLAAPKPVYHCTTVNGQTTIVWPGHTAQMPYNMVRYFIPGCKWIVQPALPHFTRPTETIRSQVMSPQELDQDVQHHFELAAVGDLTGYGTSALRYDQNGNLYITGAGTGAVFNTNDTIVSPVDGSGNVNVDVQTNTAPIAAGTNSIGTLNNWVPAQAATCVVPCNVVLRNTAGTLGYVTFVSGSNQPAGASIACYDNATTNSGTLVFGPSTWGANQTIQYGNGRKLTNGLTCAFAGTALSGTQFFEGGFHS